jgi:serine acetyltransferase
MKLEPLILRAPFSILYRALFRKIRNTYGIELPYTVQLGRRVVIEHQSCIVIHGECSIGDDCIIRQGVTLGNRYLDRPFDAPKLGNRVNVGAGAKIFGNVTIGDDVNIGANAVVLSDIPSGKTAVGIPQKSSTTQILETMLESVTAPLFLPQSRIGAVKNVADGGNLAANCLSLSASIKSGRIRWNYRAFF